jgi:hypothetical protein
MVAGTPGPEFPSPPRMKLQYQRSAWRRWHFPVFGLAKFAELSALPGDVRRFLFLLQSMKGRRGLRLKIVMIAIEAAQVIKG